ncbi:hypothetical protein EJB05_49445 [Eragrostis curvula]|uniref:Uncharacterized protein n=1 Tax=Eragrostis curvula TaxID=38414 RepID=A0A5J9T4B3_9POAL|nr:hypothetical protein EJB05_49445 [Eragrostis curvula]
MRSPTSPSLCVNGGNKAANDSWTSCSKLARRKEENATLLLSQAEELKNKDDKLVSKLVADRLHVPIHPHQD